MLRRSGRGYFARPADAGRAGRGTRTKIDVPTPGVESISSSFMNLPEYANRNRTNAQFVGDLYNAILRRGGDRPGVQSWIDKLNAQTLTRDQVRQQIIASPEFNNRVNAIVSQGCMS